MNLTLSFGEQQIYTSERMQRYPKLARLFNRTFGYTNVGNYARFTIFKQLVKKVDLPKNGKVLDLGAGYGEYSFSLAKASPGLNIHALDIDAERVGTIKKAIAQSNTENIAAHCCYLEELDESGFDFIFSIDVFEHIKPEEMPFKAAFEKLKSGGHLMVKIPNVTQQTIFPEGWFEEHNDWLEEEHVGQVYDLRGLKQRFENEGFEVVFAAYSDGWWSRLAWELAYLGKKAGTVTQLLTLPIAKGLIKLDRLVHGRRKGNAIQVIGKKP